jgi:uracil phosphoribosyltransferase
MIKELYNPVIQSLISSLRDTNTDALRFRHIVKEVTKLLLYEGLQNASLLSKEVQTWRGMEQYEVLDESSFVVVTVLRAGMPMLESVMETLPQIRGGFLAMKRDEVTHMSKLYYDRLPECEGKTVIVVDVMLATGGSLCDAIEIVKTKNPKEILCLNIIGAPEGLQKVQSIHPDVNILIAQIDERLNENKFIIPGLGDAGDREYNTPADQD